MPTCSIKWCGKSSAKCNYQKDGITFHRYPHIPEMKAKWIEATHREENWFPSKTSVVCSRHFSEDKFHLMKTGRRLLNSAVPHLYLPTLVYDISKGATEADTEQKFISTSYISLTPQLTTQSTNTTEISQLASDEKEQLHNSINELLGIIEKKNEEIQCLKSQLSYQKKRANQFASLISKTKVPCRDESTQTYETFLHPSEVRINESFEVKNVKTEPETSGDITNYDDNMTATEEAAIETTIKHENEPHCHDDDIKSENLEEEPPTDEVGEIAEDGFTSIFKVEDDGFPDDLGETCAATLCETLPNVSRHKNKCIEEVSGIDELLDKDKKKRRINEILE